MLSQITPLILTYNEAPNIERTLQKLTWAKRIVVIDSYSTDETIELISTYPQADVFQRKFDTHTNQWNYGLEQVDTDWVLSLDADYVLTDDLVNEMSYLFPPADVDGYFVSFQYCVFGKPLRGSILPPRQMLFRRGHSIYIDDGHTQLLSVERESAFLKKTVLHDDRKPLSRWLWAQDRYMIIEAKKLLETNDTALSVSDRLRKLKLLAPLVVLVYCLILKGGVLDGWRGWYYAFQRMFAEILLSLKLMEMTLP
ncbi:MAG: glycosyl transferase [Leptolyngbya foveolarum]|uniref:Glycosyl transferase n=1 Tax=Leptolyngbya foveolarum TaxID=47253 RepID=A0A2W4U614_9CYAN|nr:MAG: glycosyl transferase [Leptolyngbya foveolarum]